MSDGPVDQVFCQDVLKRIRRQTRCNADSEDLFQAAFLRLEQYRKSHDVSNPTGFIVKTAVNIWIDNHRQEKHRRAYVSEYRPENLDHQPTQEEIVAARARFDRAKSGIAQLSPRVRQVFLMHRMDGLKYREIAQRLGISQSAVEKHIMRASLFLTTWLEGW